MKLSDKQDKQVTYNFYTQLIHRKYNYQHKIIITTETARASIFITHRYISITCFVSNQAHPSHTYSCYLILTYIGNIILGHKPKEQQGPYMLNKSQSNY
jgi:hypothetical protein